MAWAYAVLGSSPPTKQNPAYVYEIEVDENDGFGTKLYDPVLEISTCLGTPYDPRSYHHDGDMEYLLGVARPDLHPEQLTQAVRQPPTSRHTPRPPNLRIELEAIVRALRDAEVLAYLSVPARQITRRIPIA